MTKYLVLFLLISIGCSTSKPSHVGRESEAAVESTHAQDSFILDELIVKIKSDARLEEILKDFEGIALSHKEDIAPRSGLFLLTYDLQLISSDEVLDHVRAHDAIVEVQFNKNLQGRD